MSTKVSRFQIPPNPASLQKCTAMISVHHSTVLHSGEKGSDGWFKTLQPKHIGLLGASSFFKLHNFSSAIANSYVLGIQIECIPVYCNGSSLSF